MLFPHFFLSAQNTKDYYLEIKQGYELGTIQQITNPDQTLNISLTNQDFANVLNNSGIYTFERMYPTAQTPRLQRISLKFLRILQMKIVFYNEMR